MKFSCQLDRLGGCTTVDQVNTISAKIITEMRGADLIDCNSMRFQIFRINKNRNGDKFSRGTFFKKITDVVFASEPSPPHNSQRIDANTDATNNTTKTTQIQAHFTPSGTRFNSCARTVVSCMMRTCSLDREWAKTHALLHTGESGPCGQREPTRRVLIVIVIENRKKDEQRERERKRVV